MVSRSARLEVILGLKDNTKKGFASAQSGAKKFNDTLKGMRTQFALVGAAAAGFAVISVKAASDLEESRQASEVTFKDSFKAIDEFANGAAAAFNLSRRAAFQYTAELGGIFNASGLATQASAQMSIAATKLAADLASFRNLEIDDALTKIRAGLVGEVEPLRRVGVLLSEAAVQSKAMQLGMEEVNGEFTQGQKVQARFALIMEQLADAQGDVARTSESVANQTRRTMKNFEELKAEIGNELLPITADLLDKLNGILQAFTALPGPARQSLVAVGALVGVLAAIGFTVPLVISGLASVGTALGTLALAVNPATLAIGSLAAGVGVLAVGMKDLESDVRAAEESLYGIDGVLKTIGEQRKYDNILEQIIRVEDEFQDFGNNFRHVANSHALAFGDIATVTQNYAEVNSLAMTGAISMYQEVQDKTKEFAVFTSRDIQQSADDIERSMEEEARSAADAHAIIRAEWDETARVAVARAERIRLEQDDMAASIRGVVRSMKDLGLEAVDINEIMGETGLKFELVRTEIEQLEDGLKAAGLEGLFFENIMAKIKDRVEEVNEEIVELFDIVNPAATDPNQGLTGIDLMNREQIAAQKKELDDLQNRLAEINREITMAQQAGGDDPFVHPQLFIDKASIEAEIERLRAILGGGGGMPAGSGNTQTKSVDQLRAEAAARIAAANERSYFDGSREQGNTFAGGSSQFVFVFPNASGMLARSDVEKIAIEVMNQTAQQSNVFDSFNIGAGNTSDIR